MRTVIITKKVYRWNELPVTAKEKAKEFYLEHFADWRMMDFMAEIEYNLEDLFANEGRSKLSVEADFSATQGSGLNVYGKLSFDAFHDAVRRLTRYADEDFPNYLRNGMSEIDWSIIGTYYWEHIDDECLILPKNSSPYCYCVAGEILFAERWIEALTEKGVPHEPALIRHFQDFTQDFFAWYCKYLEEIGRKALIEMDDDEMEDLAEANDWEFLEDGTLYVE